MGAAESSIGIGTLNPQRRGTLSLANAARDSVARVRHHPCETKRPAIVARPWSCASRQDYLPVGGVVVLAPPVVLDFSGSDVAGLGSVVAGAVPDGVLGGLIVPVVVDGAVMLSGVVAGVEPLPADAGDGDVSPAGGGVAVVVDVVDELLIELSVFGVSVLLQAPSAARVAAMATHLIEGCMFAPRVVG